VAIIQYIAPTQPTGSIDGLTFYKNGGQIAMRSRVRPTVPTSNSRTYTLNAITILSDLWEQLTNAQRIGWGAYAYNTPKSNAWNLPVYIRGYAHFMRSNRPRHTFGVPLVLDPPAPHAGVPTYTTPVFFQITPTSSYMVKLNPSDSWAAHTGGYLFGWMSRPQREVITRPPEIYARMVAIPGNSVFPPSTFPVHIPHPEDPQKGNYWVRWSASNTDGTLSGL
jgi:hypothetical protein